MIILGSDVMEPMIVGSDVVEPLCWFRCYEPMIVGGFRGTTVPDVIGIVKDKDSIARNIKEAIYIRANDPSLNRNIGKFQLPHIWDEVLARSPELHL